MSLINDALKRAKQAQLRRQPQPSPGPDFRPVQAAQQASLSNGLVPKVGLAVIAGLLLLLAWRGLHASRPADRPLASSSQLIPSSQPSSKPIQAQPAKSGPRENAQIQTPPTKSPNLAEESNAPQATALATVAQTKIEPPQRTNLALTAASPQAPAPEPASIKLQGIIFNPRRPSALINGQTLFLGDSFRDWKLAEIGDETVVLVNAGQTNVLTLDY